MENTTDQNATAPAAAETAYDTPYDAGDRRHVERREKTAKTARLQRNEDFRWLMGEQRGRRFVWDLLAKAGLFRSSLGISPKLTAFNEGRRDLGLSVLADMMRLCPSNTPACRPRRFPSNRFPTEKLRAIRADSGAVMARNIALWGGYEFNFMVGLANGTIDSDFIA